MQCGLHRRRRDPVGVDDPGLERQDDPNGGDDGDRPVDRDAGTAREALCQPVNRVSQRRRRRRVKGSRAPKKSIVASPIRCGGQ